MLTRRQTLAAAFLALPAASCGNKATATHHDLASRIVGGIINPTLEHLHGDDIPVSENARALLFAIGMAETGYAVNHQIGGGPALGFWQMEPATAKDLLKWLVVRHPKARVDVHNLTHGARPLDALRCNPLYACALARCFFLRRAEPLPPIDLETIARYWKKVWNTHAGKGTVSGFMARVSPAWPKEWRGA